METYKIRFSDGSETGPLTLEDVKKFIVEKKLKGTSMVHTETSGKWRLAASIVEVRDLIREFDDTQDGVLDRIRPEGTNSNTMMVKKKRQEAKEGPKGFWKRMLGGGSDK